MESNEKEGLYSPPARIKSMNDKTIPITKPTYVWIENKETHEIKMGKSLLDKGDFVEIQEDKKRAHVFHQDEEGNYYNKGFFDFVEGDEVKTEEVK